MTQEVFSLQKTLKDPKNGKRRRRWQQRKQTFCLKAIPKAALATPAAKNNQHFEI